jgi:hypothetical protein
MVCIEHDVGALKGNIALSASSRVFNIWIKTSCGSKLDLVSSDCYEPLFLKLTKPKPDRLFPKSSPSLTISSQKSSPSPQAQTCPPFVFCGFEKKICSVKLSLNLQLLAVPKARIENFCFGQFLIL